MVTIRKMQDGRTKAWVSLDGATRFKLEEEDHIKIKMSPHRLGIITNPSDNLTNLW
eukprot:CAMPEP_0202963586 /NCGR_PEP_ID=MMETSP1396-20130829/7596_1 /ASSEMBLY_ACC=CAM_ASM_000872 /TAXON_ID= /ORGANISM="Pseudokeronopsis sp., Strain Brazil" /LENGTH=55 /DNA_ID=CAMNT_0049684933 /DNA_START=923 /DNA_END=1087 /DNA_ORIENTATION=+